MGFGYGGFGGCGGYGGGCGYGGYGGGYVGGGYGSTFVLVVVLFILLIIVGASFL
ncbi:YjcZ family sporulation protein [Bacillus sp. YC2]|uniref:YjcZ family sporulation protein n=1 Tax=Bacillus sp. YC2 TaxID=2861287 RepID=UPI001CA6C1EC|nr:YjcZ family sporulation protein [Bacillus sp. YC2]MBY8912453.1 YjcZ family sporulation protein [Bacillus sp. YC2]